MIEKYDGGTAGVCSLVFEYKCYISKHLRRDVWRQTGEYSSRDILKGDPLAPLQITCLKAKSKLHLRYGGHDFGGPTRPDFSVCPLCEISLQSRFSVLRREALCGLGLAHEVTRNVDVNRPTPNPIDPIVTYPCALCGRYLIRTCRSGLGYRTFNTAQLMHVILRTEWCCYGPRFHF